MIVVLVLLLGLALLLPGGNEDDVVEPTPTTVAPEPETMSDLEVIEAGVAAFYSGDGERAAELFQLPDRTDDQIRAEAAYQAAIGGRLTLSCTEGTSTPGAFTCTAPYHNAATDAIGFVDKEERIDVVVEDGVITEFGFPEHTWMVIQFGVFLATEGRFEGYEDCANWPVSRVVRHHPNGEPRRLGGVAREHGSDQSCGGRVELLVRRRLSGGPMALRLALRLLDIVRAHTNYRIRVHPGSTGLRRKL